MISKVVRIEVSEGVYGWIDPDTVEAVLPLTRSSSAVPGSVDSSRIVASSCVFDVDQSVERVMEFLQGRGTT